MAKSIICNLTSAGHAEINTQTFKNKYFFLIYLI